MQQGFDSELAYAYISVTLQECDSLFKVVSALCDILAVS